MLPARDLFVAALLSVALGAPTFAESAPERERGGTLFNGSDFGSRREPITVTADTLEYDYKANVVVYRGDVVAVQGDMKVRSDTLTVTFAAAEDKQRRAAASERLQQIVAVGGVRIENGTRWATGGRAVFDQGARTLILTETPVLHEGSNEVAGDRVIVYLDENRSVVEGGRKRVKAVLHPSKEEAAPPPREARR
jgi:lipopolysaccharide export system protein LptA